MTLGRENSLGANRLQTDRVLTVAELNESARRLLEGSFPLCWVAGEISNLSRAASGHVYFSLKDARAQVRCAMFRNRAQLLPFRLTEGMQVEVRALVSLYEPRGEFQLTIEGVRRAGIGALYQAFIRLKEKLEREGWFAAEAKRPLPRYPRRVAVVTSLQAAALQDVLAALVRRAPRLPVVICPTPVQGEGAERQIAAAIMLAGCRANCDVVIVARGGGSIEDLWAFNHESVARAVRDCPVPVVSGVGHESDVTIIDLVADHRAATPTAAAELATAGFVDAAQRLRVLQRVLRSDGRRQLDARSQRVDRAALRLTHPGQTIARMQGHLQGLQARLDNAARRRVERCGSAVLQVWSRLWRARPDLARHADRIAALRLRVPAAQGLLLNDKRAAICRLRTNLEHLDPKGILARGYSLVRNASGVIVRSSREVSAGEVVQIDFGEGRANAGIIDRSDS